MTASVTHRAAVFKSFVSIAVDFLSLRTDATVARRFLMSIT